MNIARYHGQEQAVALAAVSEDYGRTWTPSHPSNLPMVASKPYTGTLSTGRHYLTCTTTADSGNRRSPLTIALTRPGEGRFSQVYVIRHAQFPEGIRRTIQFYRDHPEFQVIHDEFDAAMDRIAAQYG